MQKVKVIKVVNRSTNPLPNYETEGSAGMDLRANITEPITLFPMERALIPTGLTMAIPIGYEGQVRPRSGLAIKHGITMINCVGTIDSDFRGELKVPLVNLSDEPYMIDIGERIAQFVLSEIGHIKWELTEELDETERGRGGFGSTGK